MEGSIVDLLWASEYATAIEAREQSMALEVAHTADPKAMQDRLNQAAQVDFTREEVKAQVLTIDDRMDLLAAALGGSVKDNRRRKSRG